MLKIDHVSYAYDNFEALRDVSLNVEEGEILCLLGPSGCGKTTLLRVIAGLEVGYTGDVQLEEQDMRDVPVHARDFGLMFQDFALFPHMTVGQNIAYGLKRQNLNKQDINKQVQAMLERVGLSGLNNRDVNLLSGGQKQRVALARSLAPNPRLLMLDEPLGSLDALLREKLIVELRDIIKSIGLTAIYVTHDQKEAYAIADRIAAMNKGQIEQVDTPQNIYYKPQTEFVARFLGLSNIFPIDAVDSVQDWVISHEQFADAQLILIHPAGIRTDSGDGQPQLTIMGVIEQIVFRGDVFEVTASIQGGRLLKWVTQFVEFSIGDDIEIFVDSDFIVPLQ